MVKYQFALAGLVHLASAAVPTLSGYTLTWSDDFVGTANSLPNTANWIIDTGTSYPGGPSNWGTGEIQTYTSSPTNVRLTGDGNLRITAVKTSSGQWTSARIETTRTNFQAAAGKKLRIQASIKLPDVTGAQAAGYWAAFWALGAPFRGNYQNWPSVGEFDIMENVNGGNNVVGALHCGTNPGGPCDESNGIASSTSCPGSNCQGNFHTYAFEVDRTTSPEKLVWYVDGQQFHSVTQTRVGASTWADMMSHGYFILFNVALGGGFPNAVYGSQTPTSSTESGKFMDVDYVAVYNS